MTRTENVTSVEKSRSLVEQGKDIYTAGWYWEKSRLASRRPWNLHPVPEAGRQLQLEERDRFFKIYQADVRRGTIIPAWSEQSLKNQ